MAVASQRRFGIRREVRARYPFGGNLPLDGLPTVPLKFAASTERKLRTGYNGNIYTVHDGTSGQPIGFKNNLVDVAAVADFCDASASNGYLSLWNDQSGNAYGVTQGTASQRPKVYDSAGDMVRIDGHPVGEYVAASNRCLTRSDALGITGNPGLDIFAVIQAPSTANNYFFALGPFVGGQQLTLRATSTNRIYITNHVGGMTHECTGEDLTTGLNVVHLRGEAGAEIQDYTISINGTAGSIVFSLNPTSTVSITDSGFFVSTLDGSSNPFEGDMAEVVVYASATGNALTSVQAAQVAQNMLDYYG